MDSTRPANAPARSRVPVSRTWRSICTTLATLSLGACAALPPQDMRSAADFQRQASVEDRPVTRPVRAVSSFSESLACMDRMLRDHKVGSTLITSKQIPDMSGRAPVGTKDIVITTLSQMSRVSNAFRFVDYEVDLLRQDTVQNLTGLLLHSNQIQLQRPLLYVSGAIVYIDQSVLSNQANVGVSGSRLDAGISGDKNASVLGLELHLGEFRTRTLIPGIDAANEIVVGSRGQGADVAAKIGRYGLQFTLSREATIGTGAAVRTLVELGMIELVGKWARVPYWQCLMTDTTHPEFQRQMRDWFEEMDAPARQQIAARGLAARGYLADAARADQSALRDALARFQAGERVVVSGELTFETYERLMHDYVALDEQGRFVKVGWPASFATGGAAASAPLPAVAPLDLTLRIANNNFNEGVFDAGQRIYLSATLSRAGHLYCFYQDAGGRVSRLFPNPFQRSAQVVGSSAVRMPDWMSGAPGYAIESLNAGTERVACHATDQDVFAALPETLKGQAILPLAGVGSLDTVDQAFAQVAAGATRRMLSWEIRPLPPSAAPQAPAYSAPRPPAGPAPR